MRSLIPILQAHSKAHHHLHSPPSLTSPLIIKSNGPQRTKPKSCRSNINASISHHRSDPSGHHTNQTTTTHAPFAERKGRERSERGMPGAATGPYQPNHPFNASHPSTTTALSCDERGASAASGVCPGRRRAPTNQTTKPSHHRRNTHPCRRCNPPDVAGRAGFKPALPTKPPLTQHARQHAFRPFHATKGARAQRAGYARGSDGPLPTKPPNHPITAATPTLADDATAKRRGRFQTCPTNQTTTKN